MTPILPAGAAGPAALTRPVAAGPAPARSFESVLRAASPPGGGDGRPLDRPGVGPGAPGPAGLLQGVDRARARLEGVLAAARSGRTFTAQELLGLQAEAYRTVQTIDLASKLAEQGAQAVRQTLGTQV